MYRAVGLPRNHAGALKPPTLSTKYLQYRNRGLEPIKRAAVYRLLQLGWSPRAIADREGVAESTVYEMMAKVKKFSALTTPPELYKKLSRKFKIREEDSEALFRELVCYG
jgi:transposase